MSALRSLCLHGMSTSWSFQKRGGARHATTWVRGATRLAAAPRGRRWSHAGARGGHGVAAAVVTAFLHADLSSCMLAKHIAGVKNKHSARCGIKKRESPRLAAQKRAAPASAPAGAPAKKARRRL